MLIEYNFSRDYCSDWTAIEALREIVQNAMDKTNDYSCVINDKVIKITNDGGPLDPSVFSMGVSVKGHNSIGKYGEGFKIAMLVLTRLGHDPIIYTGDLAVTGIFGEHEFTGVETFKLDITKRERFVNGVEFICDIKDIDLAELKTKITPFDEQPLPKVRNKVEILYTRPGMLYVNGLFVCKDKDLSLGYNFAPDSITLNRDRNMVDGTIHQLAKYYGALGKSHAETIFNLVENEARDVAWLSWNITNDDLRAELARLFYNKYGEGATIKQTTGYYGGSSIGVSCSSNRYDTFRACGIQETVRKVDPTSPLGQMETFLANNKKRMRRDLRVAFEGLLVQAKAWKK